MTFLKKIELKAISKVLKSLKFSSDFLSFAFVMNVTILVLKKKANLVILLWQSWLSGKVQWSLGFFSIYSCVYNHFLMIWSTLSQLLIGLIDNFGIVTLVSGALPGLMLELGLLKIFLGEFYPISSHCGGLQPCRALFLSVF